MEQIGTGWNIFKAHFGPPGRRVRSGESNRRCWPPVALCAVLLATLPISAATAADEDSAVAEAERRWGEAIRAFEEADRRDPPPQDGILFVGSSSIRLWKLDEHFPDLPVINRGFGGSQVSDTLHFADRIVLPYKPRIVVLYAGDNDIAAGESPEQVADDFGKLVRTIHDALPRTRVAFIAIKPSVARWGLYDKMRDVNERIHAVCDENERIAFVDIATPMLGKDGQPRKELFVDDGLHLNEAGYRLWTEIVTPHLKAGEREPE